MLGLILDLLEVTVDENERGMEDSVAPRRDFSVFMLVLYVGLKVPR